MRAEASPRRGAARTTSLHAVRFRGPACSHIATRSVVRLTPRGKRHYENRDLVGIADRLWEFTQCCTAAAAAAAAGERSEHRPDHATADPLPEARSALRLRP